MIYSRLLILMVLMAGSLASCHVDQSLADGWTYTERNKEKYNNQSPNIERKILFSAYLSLTVQNPEIANLCIEKIAVKYGGYISQVGTSKTMIRVKSVFLDSAVTQISNLGRVEHKNVKGQDITEDYLDYQIRLENAEKARQRYLELLAMAEDVSSALQVEKELERLNQTIDLLKGKISRINHLSEFSTITINLAEKTKPGVLGYVGIGIYRSVKWLFVRN